MMKLCRSCHGHMGQAPFFVLKNMPDSAQGFLESTQLSDDKGIDIEIYQCPYCGLVQLLCEPVPYYREVIRATGFSDEMRAFRTEQFKELSNRFDLKGKKIIEYGAGKGDMVEIAANATGCEIYGLEYGDAAVAACKEKGLNVRKGYLSEEEEVLPEGPFDAFYTFNFMEHMPEPEAFLKGAYRNLTEDGIGLIEVPNCDMIFKENLYSEFISDHLMYFTKETLESLIKRNGFEIIECKAIWYDYIISALVRKRNPMSGEGMNRQYQKMRNLLHDFLADRKQYGEIAIWGAGHQSIANLSVLDLKDYVSCVIDSAPFKQNKFTPASHLLVVSPEVLNRGEIKTVLIMAGSYSDEIGRIIKEKYPTVKGYILRQDALEDCSD